MSEVIMPVSGVYAITHRLTGRCYVGASTNIFARFGSHRRTFKRHEHSKAFQADWDRDGESAFRFEVLETAIARHELAVREQYWMEKLTNLYNRNAPMAERWRDAWYLPRATRSTVTVPADSDDEWLTTQEIAGMLKTHEQTVRRWLRSGELAGVLIADKAGYRVRLRDLEAFLRSRGWMAHDEPPPPPAAA